MSEEKFDVVLQFGQLDMRSWMASKYLDNKHDGVEIIKHNVCNPVIVNNWCNLYINSILLDGCNIIKECRRSYKNSDRFLPTSSI